MSFLNAIQTSIQVLT